MLSGSGRVLIDQGRVHLGNERVLILCYYLIMSGCLILYESALIEHDLLLVQYDEQVLIDHDMISIYYDGVYRLCDDFDLFIVVHPFC